MNGLLGTKLGHYEKNTFYRIISEAILLSKISFFILKKKRAIHLISQQS